MENKVICICDKIKFNLTDKVGSITSTFNHGYNFVKFDNVDIHLILHDSQLQHITHGDKEMRKKKKPGKVRSASVCVMATNGTIKRLKRNEAEKLVDEKGYVYVTKSKWREQKNNK